MTQYESAIHELAERLNGADASLTTSIAEILVGPRHGLAVLAGRQHRLQPPAVRRTTMTCIAVTVWCSV